MSTYGLYTVIWIVEIAAAVYCFLDWQKHSEGAFEAAGMPKTTALILIIVGALCCWLTLLYYFFVLKPKVEAAEAGGGFPPAV